MTDVTSSKQAAPPREVAVGRNAGKPRAPGIYFGLPEDEYHRDPSLGSSNVRDLWYSPTDYWWGSHHNPNREDDDDEGSDAKTRGKAMHRLVLEGEAAFDAEYARGPDHDRSMTPSEKGQATKKAKADAAAGGRTMIAAVDFDRIVIASAMISKNPHLATAFTGGLPEVSIFWVEEVEGMWVPCKARIDWLKPRGLGDLKSITTWRKIEFKRACRDAITNYRYDMQAAHYMRARRALPLLYENGCVSGDHDEDLLEQVARTSRFAFQFIFFQASRSPITHSVTITPAEANPIYMQAERDLDSSLLTYREHVERFGLDEPWLLLEKPQELAIEEMPPWYARK